MYYSYTFFYNTVFSYDNGSLYSKNLHERVYNTVNPKSNVSLQHGFRTYTGTWEHFYTEKINKCAKVI